MAWQVDSHRGSDRVGQLGQRALHRRLGGPRAQGPGCVPSFAAVHVRRLARAHQVAAARHQGRMDGNLTVHGAFNKAQL